MTNIIIIKKINETLKKEQKREKKESNKDTIKRISKEKWKE